MPLPKGQKQSERLTLAAYCISKFNVGLGMGNPCVSVLLRDRPSDGAAWVSEKFGRVVGYGGQLVVPGWCRKDAGIMMCARVRGSFARLFNGWGCIGLQKFMRVVVENWMTVRG